MKTLYVSDLDGTLLNSNGKISPYSLSAINDLMDKGLLFTYATARSYLRALPVMRELRVKIPVIVYGGAFLIAPASGKIISSHYFTESEKHAVMGLLDEHSVLPMVFSHIDGVEKLSWLTGCENGGTKRFVNFRKGDKRLNPIEDTKSLCNGETFGFTCAGDREALLPVFEALTQNGICHCTFYRDVSIGDYLLEIMPKDATKAKAAETLKLMYHCDRLVAFGDQLNDLDLFAVSDVCYAVANAAPELQKAATAVIESNDEDGVARWLVEHFHN